MEENRNRDGAALRQQREVWSKQASHYDREMGLWERLLFKDARAWLCSQASGRVLEVAIGTGRNIEFYPLDVDLTGIDLSPEMLAIARDRAELLGRAVDLREGNAHALEFASASFDTVVCALAMCNIPNQEAALAEMFRVLRAEGQLLLVDHIGSSNRWIRAGQHMVERLSVRFMGEHLTRRPRTFVAAAGFEIVDHRRYGLGIVEELVARKPPVCP